jgi:hypothetical protein
VAGAGGLTGRGGVGGVGVGGISKTGGATGTGGVAGGSGRGGAGGIGGKGGAGGAGGVGGKGGVAGAGGIGGKGGITGTGGIGGKGGAGGKGGVDGGGGIDGGRDVRDTGDVRDAGDVGDTGPSPIQPLIDAFCTAARNCCGSSGSTSLADCEQKFPSRFEFYPLVDKGTVSIDPTLFAACVAAYKTAATTCTMTGLNAACMGVFVGNRTEGQSCGGASRFGSYECKPVKGSASCYWKDSTSYPNATGECVTIPHGKSGDPCTRSCRNNEPCIVDMIGGAAPFAAPCFEEDGLYCSVSKSPAVCKPILQTGEACTWDPGCCGSDNFCGWTGNTCQAPAGLGASCENLQCGEDLMCGTRNRCVEAPLSTSSACEGIPPAP